MTDIPLNKLIKWNKYISQRPFANQILFLRSQELEVLYGGAARGGKSVAMLMAALQYVDIAHYNALILRRNFAELNLGGALIPVSKEWLSGTDAHWSETKNTWTFPSGATLTFGYLENKNDVYRYLGSEYQFIGFDELTEQPEDNYRFLFTRLVRNKELEKAGVPLRMRATTNPGGEYAEWVYERFISKESRKKYREIAITNAVGMAAREGKELYESDITEEMIRFRVPRFIPSKVTDNPHVDLTSYLASLAEVDEVRKAQYLDGNWEIHNQGNMFKREWFYYHADDPVVKFTPKAVIDYSQMRELRYWDFAATTDETSDYTASCKLGYCKKDGYFYITDFFMNKKTPGDVEKEFRVKQRADGPHVITVIEQEPGSGGVNTIDYYKRKVSIPGFIFYADKVTGDKESRARPVAAAAGNGLMRIVDTPIAKTWFSDFMAQLEAFPLGSHDDGVDVLAGSYNWLTKHLRLQGRFIGKMTNGADDGKQTSMEPAYMKNEKGKNIGDMLLSNPMDMFRVPYKVRGEKDEPEKSDK